MPRKRTGKDQTPQKSQTNTSFRFRPKNDSAEHNQPLVRLESALFGPKLEVPQQAGRAPSPASSSRRGSVSKSLPRKATPTPTSSRRNSSTTRLEVPKLKSPKPPATPRRRTRSGSRFDSPVKVENLACRSPQRSCEGVVAAPSEARQRWLNRQANEERARAFTVLEKEMNNNSVSKCDRESNYASFYKDQKWMSPWYNPPS